MRAFRLATWALLCATTGLAVPFAAAQAPASQPAPTEKVMRPTELSLRLTPRIARGLTGVWLREELWKELSLDEDQQRQIADAAARRMLKIAHRSGREGADAMEYLIETQMATDGKVTAENAREFSEKMRPFVRAGREFIEGIVEDARPVLSDEQMRELEAEIKRELNKLDRFERRLDNYAEGHVKEGGEKPFDELEQEMDEAGRKRDPRMQHARRMAQWDVQRITSWQWSRFLAAAATLFKFDEAQRTKGDSLLAEYRKKADAIQTPEWKARIHRNRTLAGLRMHLKDVPTGPWLYRLDREYKEATRPLVELTDRFYAEVLAIAAPEQRAAAIEEARALAEQHGLAASAEDLAMLHALVEPPPATAQGG